MQKSLFNNIDFRNIDCVGFDLDGTLYDEKLFVEQVYKQISNLYNLPKLYEFMINRWNEKGSSYPHIYEECYKKYYLELNNISCENFIENCLKNYRNFRPILQLSKNTLSFLEYCKNNFKTFLITDGTISTQKNKINSLDVEKYFDFKIFSNDYKTSKDNIILKDIIDFSCKRVIYFGDRTVDKVFAEKNGFEFIKVKNMEVVNAKNISSNRYSF